MPTNIEDIDDELDEEAITADEPPPTIIEEDLFSDSEADPSKNINVPIIEGSFPLDENTKSIKSAF